MTSASSSSSSASCSLVLCIAFCSTEYAEDAAKNLASSTSSSVLRDRKRCQILEQLLTHPVLSANSNNTPEQCEQNRHVQVNFQGGRRCMKDFCNLIQPVGFENRYLTNIFFEYFMMPAVYIDQAYTPWLKSGGLVDMFIERGLLQEGSTLQILNTPFFEPFFKNRKPVTCKKDGTLCNLIISTVSSNALIKATHTMLQEHETDEIQSGKKCKVYSLIGNVKKYEGLLDGVDCIVATVTRVR